MEKSLESRSNPSRAAWSFRGGAPPANLLVAIAVILAVIAVILILSGGYGGPAETKTVVVTTIVSQAPLSETQSITTETLTERGTSIPSHGEATTTTRQTSSEAVSTVEVSETKTIKTVETETTTIEQTTAPAASFVEGIESSLVGPEGGRVVLGAVEIHFPRGSVEGEANVSAGLIRKDISEEAGTTLIYKVELRGGSLKGEVELRFRYDENILPEGVSEEDAQVGYLDEEGKYHSVEAVINTEKNIVVVRTNHFSLWILSWPSRGQESWRPSVEKKILEVPYYPQGETGYCWATSMAMLIKYYDRDTVYPKPWEIASDYGIATDEGVSSLEFWTGLHTSDMLYVHLKAFPERHMWFPAIRTKGFAKYVVSSILEGDPVVVFLEDHVVVIVGYYKAEGGEINYYIHDPADPKNGIYKMVSQSQLFSEISGTEAVFTLRMPLGGTKEEDPPVTVIVPSGVIGQDRPQGLSLVPVEGDMAPDTIYRIIWNGTRKPFGYYLGIEERRGKSMILVERAAPDTYKLYVQYGVANTAQKTVSVRVIVYVQTPGSALLYVGSEEYSLGPGEYIEDFIESWTGIYEISDWPSESANEMAVIVKVIDSESHQLYDSVEFVVPLKPWSYLRSDEAKNSIITALGLNPEVDEVSYTYEGWTGLPITEAERLPVSITVNLEARRSIWRYEWDCDPSSEGKATLIFYNIVSVGISHSIRSIGDLSKYSDMMISLLTEGEGSQPFWACPSATQSIEVSEPLVRSIEISGGKALIIEAQGTLSYTSEIEGVTPLSIPIHATFILWSKDDAVIAIMYGLPEPNNYDRSPLPTAEEILSIIIDILAEKGLISESASGGAR